MNLPIEKATTSDSTALSELTMRSKAHWGYSDQQLEQWREDLQVSAQYLEQNEAFLTRTKDQIQGYYSFSRVSESIIKLDNIFVDPAFIGTGLGHALMTDFLERAKKLGTTTITLDAEPNAEPFYQKFGFQTVGQLKSSIPNRFLPVMELRLHT